ncbi:MAG: universal stress protein [Deltaproteobacteria bacterium]|nr:universal stress protein [Deltaproteobacteria bacterium]MBI4795617.1 universal stress protein [Deltaproteobacteria bacterium]
MAHKILVALDASEGAWRAVEYVARTFGQTPGVEVTLMHILTGLPPAFWDDGHILEDKEREARQRLIAQWQADQEKNWQGLLAKAKESLAAAGIPAAAVAGKFKPKYYDVAEDIINEAVSAGCSTVVMGRRGLGKAKALLLGSVTTKVVQNARGCAVTIV